jgi:ectoine hydroxylase-related dioxygenase (phytanoyl-CoA dioxygenase family)
MQILDASKQMISDLWLDQPDAHERIEERRQLGQVSDADAERLRHFSDHGYMSISIGLDEAFAQGLMEDIEKLWQDRPHDLAVAAKSGDRMSFRDYEGDRAVGYRIPDLHSHSPRARDLYLHPEIFRMVELIFDQPAVAFQSLYFQFGSEQSLHRDPMFVVTKPPSHLVAAWIALEDITPGSGPLLYAPGSHRMPWFEFDDDTVNVAVKAEAKEKRQEWVRYRARMLDEMGLEVKAFTCKRGDVFLWHGGLLHGGDEVREPGTTRKSYVVHYSTAAHYTSRKATMQMKFVENGQEVWKGVGGTTERLLKQGGHSGIDNPLRELKLPTPR